MRYLLHSLKCLVVGIAAALGAFVVAILVVVLLDAVMYSVPILERVGAIASSGLGTVSPTLEPAVAAIMVGFVAGFWSMHKHDQTGHRA